MEHKEKAAALLPVGSKAALTASSAFNSLEGTEGKVGHGNETVGDEAGGFLSRKRSFLKELHHTRYHSR